MLNDRIPASDIYRELKNFVDPADVILTDYRAEQEGIEAVLRPTIKGNSELLGKLHHALNIDQYEKPDFRYNLLIRADISDLVSYFKQVNLNGIAGLIPPTQTSLSSQEIFQFSKTASKSKWGNNDDTRHFVSIFGYDSSLIPQDEDVRQNTEIITTPKRDPNTNIVTLTLQDDKPFRELYFFQSDVAYKADKRIDTRYTRFIITMPTGSGKTRTAMGIATHFLNRGYDNDTEMQVLWLAESDELNEQAIENFKHVWPYLGKKDIKLYRIWGNYAPKTIEKNSFIVAGIAKLTNLLKQNPNLIAPDLIICDEAHHAVARTWKNLIEQLSTSNGTRLIGLTATPIRGTTAEDKKLIKFFLGSDNIIDIDPGDELTPIDYLQKQGYLANVERQDKIKHDSPLIVPAAIWNAVGKYRDLPDGFLEILAQDNKRNYAIAKKLLELGKAKKRTLYFGTNRFQAKLMCAVLISFDIAAAYVDGYTPKAYRKDVIKKFKNGDIDIICNCELFTTGFDEPEIQAIVIGRPTMSRILYQQMVGRGMRGPKMGGTPSFELYEMDDGLEQYGIALADRYFIDQWNEY